MHTRPRCPVSPVAFCWHTINEVFVISQGWNYMLPNLANNESHVLHGVIRVSWSKTTLRFKQSIGFYHTQQSRPSTICPFPPHGWSPPPPSTCRPPGPKFVPLPSAPTLLSPQLPMSAPRHLQTYIVQLAPPCPPHLCTTAPGLAQMNPLPYRIWHVGLPLIRF